MYLLFLALGLIVILIGLKVKDEVFRLGAGITGAIILVWGFALTPASLQLIVETIGAISVFSICRTCWECD